MAAAFSQDFIESVRNAGDIVRLISDYVPLKPAGSRLKGLCPFHEEKTPSFSVDPRNQLFYCFGCGTGGDTFKFVMLYEKLAFPEAVEFLARRWSVPLPTGGRVQPPDEHRRLLEIHQSAARFFRSMLLDPDAGRICRDYLHRRRIDPETAEKLELGYAPDAWEALGRHLVAERFKTDDLLNAGLALPRKSGAGQYDRFRDRLIFPIRDLRGRTVAFGGRTLGDGEPKYINSPESPVYKKSEHLYGLDLARDAIRRDGYAVVVEGYLDLAALVGAGIHNVVATLGTAFTPLQARLLSRYANRVCFSYDGDSAGAQATERSLDLLLSRGFEVRVVELPGGQDPDDFIGREGAVAYGRLLELAPTYLQFLINRESRTRDLTRIDEKVAAINKVLPHLARLAHPVERASWAARLADALAIEDELVLQELRQAVRGSSPRIREQALEPVTRLREAEVRLITQLLRSEQERESWIDRLSEAELDGSPVEPIVVAIRNLVAEGHEVDYPSVIRRLDDDRHRDLLTRIAFREDPEDGPTVEDCIRVFRRQRLAREGRQVTREIDELQQGLTHAPSPAEVDRRLARLQELARQRDALS